MHSVTAQQQVIKELNVAVCDATMLNR